ncbi:hypothetical protein D3260_11495 [Salinisphaera sp. Q1T1-3]|nr:MerR family DNA-binding protein [Salinisphaera sp. Q1T1-3]RJS92591.1 hypothetical protein D3260_11495 [Salinisphaera sp. Q1T1-3]
MPWSTISLKSNCYENRRIGPPGRPVASHAALSRAHGVLRRTHRDANGPRVFDTADLARVAFIKHLRATGMLLLQIRRYAELRATGHHTLTDRQTLLKTRAAV